MNRAEIRSRFRAENPEITSRVIDDATINGWMQDGDKDLCAISKCIISNTPVEITAVADLQYYDLSANISKFFDIDEYPGGGVWYDDEPLKKASEAEMNYTLRNWTSADSVLHPNKYFRRGKYLWFDYAPSSALTIKVSVVYISDNFDDDTKTPYNQLQYLEPYHPGIMKYLQWKVKAKVGKDQEAGIAQTEYYTFAKRMRKAVSGGQNNATYLVNRSSAGHSKS